MLLCILYFLSLDHILHSLMNLLLGNCNSLIHFVNIIYMAPVCEKTAHSPIICTIYIYNLYVCMYITESKLQLDDRSHCIVCLYVFEIM